jgi:hypothetical protein
MPLNVLFWLCIQNEFEVKEVEVWYKCRYQAWWKVGLWNLSKKSARVERADLSLHEPFNFGTGFR